MLRVVIEGVDRQSSVEANSLRVSQYLTRRKDIAEFSILQHTGETYVPEIGEEVVIYDDATKVYGGIITILESQPISFGLIRHRIEMQDYTRLLDAKLVPDTYRNMTVDAIIAALYADYFPAGFSIASVDAPISVASVSFNYKPLSKCIQELADLINYDWYVDYNKEVHFFAKLSEASSYDLTDTNGYYRYNSLVIRKDSTQLRNLIYVRGGNYLADTTTVEILANGTDVTYPLPYKFSDFHASVTGQQLNLGVDYLDDPQTHDALFNFQEKVLKFRDARKPTSGSVMRVSGKPNLPVIVRVRNTGSIASHTAEGGDGIYEFLIEDKSINSREAARQRASAELDTYANTLSEGEFITEKAGLVVGTRINIQSDSRGLNEDFVINRIVVSQRTSDALLYEVSLVTTKTFDWIDVMQKLLLKSNQELVIDANEVVNLIEDTSESFTFSEIFTAQALDYGVEFSAGPFTAGNNIPQAVKRIFIVDGSPLG